MRIYLAGPMTGMPERNAPAFAEAARELRKQGHLVYCPPESGTHDLATWEDFVARDMLQLAEVQAVVVLPGWSQSRGALLEVFWARVAGKAILSYPAGALQPLFGWRLEMILATIRRVFSGQGTPPAKGASHEPEHP